MISIDGVTMDQEKVQATLEWPKPLTLKGLRGFLGLTGYYRKLVEDYGKIARPLTAMLKKDAFKWTPATESALSQLKVAMTKTPVLALPDFSKPFILECDASGGGVGAGSTYARTAPNCLFQSSSSWLKSCLSNL